jgi:parallel beta-helix repeat protein
MSRYISLSFALMLLVAVPASWGAVVNVNCPGQSLQDAITAAGIDTEIDITGNCNENILVDNNKIKVYLIGAGGATINGPDANNPTLDVRGKAIYINQLTITGGNQGIQVERGSNAVIDANVIQNTGSNGIVVSQLAFAVIINNTIHNNPNHGILIRTNSTAHIGFNKITDAAASPNNIVNNGNRGILVEESSSARIYGNTISNNGSDGVAVLRAAHADIATNTINGNGTAFVQGDTDGNGVSVAQNSSVQLGEDNPPAPGTPGAFVSQPNVTTVNNANNGIRCTAGANVRGHLGPAGTQLNGNVSQFGSGANAFAGNCPTAANTLDIP